MRHAKVCSPINIQKLMDLGIYAHDSKGSKESAQLTPNVAPGAIEVLSIIVYLYGECTR